VEALEDRLLLTAYVVTTTKDILGDTTPGEVTLRDAITALDGTPSGNATAVETAANSIAFNIPGGGTQSIGVGSDPSALNQPLPAITKPVFLDGWSQGGAGYAGPPLIVLNGANAGTTAGGLRLGAGSDGSTIRGLVIQQFGNDGIDVTGASGTLITGNYIGTDVSGTASLGNGGDGVFIGGASAHNTVGGTTAAARNVISGNGGDGVDIFDSGTTANVVEGNYIGVDKNGASLIPNTVSWWKAEGNANDSVDGNSGTLVNGVTFAPGMVGQAFSLHGSGAYVDVGNASNLQVSSGAFTVEAWVKFSALAGDMSILDKMSSNGVVNSDGWRLLKQSDNHFWFALGGGRTNGATPTAPTTVISATTATTGVWYHVAAVKSSTEIAVYINGVKEASKPLPTFTDTNSTDLRIGSNVREGAYFNGLIDESAVYGRALSASEIQGIYNAGSTGKGNAVGNSGVGVLLSAGASNNAIGGTTAATRNVISGNGSDGLGLLSGATGNLVEGNYLGTNAAGTAAVFNTGSGINVNASNNTIGGASSVDPVTGDLTGAGNVISGNHASGVQVNSGSGVVVQGNFIGTDVTGMIALGNDPTGFDDGVDLNGGSNDTIGGVSSVDAYGNLSGLGNLISGNNGTSPGALSDGIFIQTTGNMVQGNFLGTDVKGTAALPNAFYGVGVRGANNTVGGTTAAARNLISGNAYSGVYVIGSGTSGNLVLGNYIGTDKNGTAALGNPQYGVQIDNGATANTVGGTTAAARNVISGNGFDGNPYAGVAMTGFGTTGNVVAGNYVGTDVTGLSALPNGWSGVRVDSGASGNTVGGTTASARNVLSGNYADGADLSGNNNVVAGNYIGTDATGTNALGNNVGDFYGGGGLVIWGGGSNNTVGGTAAGAANVLSGNGYTGVNINSSGTSGNLIAGNVIGTDPGGTQALANGGDGMVLFGGPTANTVGGTTAAAGNVISGNNGVGVDIANLGTSANLIAGNLIGTDKNGTAALGNAGDGVLIRDSASGNTIGGSAAGAGNVISGNPTDGVYITGSGSSGNLILGDLIGTNAAGTASVPNGTANNFYAGVAISSPNNTVGGTAATARNVISGNGSAAAPVAYGITINGTGATGNVVAGNYVGTDITGTVALGEQAHGHFHQRGPTQHDRRIGHRRRQRHLR
jgi:hypothetical protein